MKTATIFVAFLALSAVVAKEEAKKDKRGVFGEGLALGGHESFGAGHDSGLSLGSQGLDIGHGASLGGEISAGGFDGAHHGPIDLGTSVQKHISISKKVGILVPKPFPVTVEKNVPVPYPVEVKVPVAKPYPVPVPKPYAVPVEKPVPYTVTKHVPYPVKVAVNVPVKVPVGVPVPKPYPVTVIKHVPVAVPVPIIVKKPVPVFVKSQGYGDDSGFPARRHEGYSSGFGAGSGLKPW